MTTITINRATVEQALEALELGHDIAKAEADRYHAAMAGYKPQRHAQMDAEVQQIAAAITAMRAALAQQAEPDAYGYASRLAVAIWEKHYKDTAPHWKPLDDLVGVLTQIDNMAAGMTRLAQQAEPVEPVEPVAWVYTGIKQDGTEHGPHLVWKPEYMDAMSASKGAKATPLYTAPPQQAEPVGAAGLFTLAHLWAQQCYFKGLGRPCDIDSARGAFEQALKAYTAPPQRKPLPKHDQHCVDVPGYGLMAVRLVRAIERAHNITDPQVADHLARHGIPMP